MKRLINRLPITRIKMFFARILYRIVHIIYRKDRRIIVRNGIKYEIDLSEGIDLSMFLFGSFQKHVSQNKRLCLPQDAVVFDVGASFGMMTLQFAKLVPLGRVYSFEPTFYAYSKFKRNLELNPELAKHVVPVQSFVSSRTLGEPCVKAYASWKVGGAVEGVKHRIHGGIAKCAEGVRAISLDDFCQQSGIKRLDFIKIDTDGDEFEVLKGARKVISKFNPVIIFEVGIYLMEERNIGFLDYLRFFEPLSYSLFDSSNFKKIDADNYCRHIPFKGTIDVLAMCDA